MPTHVQLVKQDFGYSATHFAGQAAGEMGATFNGSTTSASSYAIAKPIPPHQKCSKTRCGPRAKPLPSRLRNHKAGRCFLRLFQRAATRRQRTAHWLARAGLRFRGQGGTAGGAADHERQQVVWHVHHAVSPRQVSAYTHQERRHALPLDAQLRPSGRRRQRALHVHPPQRYAHDAGLRAVAAGF